MSAHMLRMVIALTAALIPDTATAQHEGHQRGTPQTSAALAQCSQVQPVINNIITAATTRLETARLSNSPPEMRAAVDHLEAALRDIRAQLAPCAAASASNDPHAGHTMPSTPPPAGTPKSTAQPHTGAADPHAAHATPTAPAGTKTAPTSKKPAPSKPASTSTPAPHAGHAKSDPPSKSAPTSKPAPSKPSTPAAADPHAGHDTTGASPAQKATPSKPVPPKPGTPEAAEPHAHAGRAPQQQSGKQMDPVNGLMVDPSTAPKTTYQGQTYYFSSEQSRKEFLENPAKFAKKPKG